MKLQIVPGDGTCNKVNLERNKAFKKKFNKLVTDEVSPSAFETRWNELVEYRLEENKFMIRAYKMRGMWAKPYFKGIDLLWSTTMNWGKKMLGNSGLS